MSNVVRFPVERRKEKRSTGVSPFPTSLTYLPSAHASMETAKHQKKMAVLRDAMREVEDSWKKNEPSDDPMDIPAGQYVDISGIPSRVAENLGNGDMLAHLLSEIDEAMISLADPKTSRRENVFALSELVLDAIAESMELGGKFQAARSERDDNGPENRG